MSANTAERAKRELEPDDAVGNALCDALLDDPDPALIRVVNYHGDWAEAVPNWQDFRIALSRCPSVVAKFPIDGRDAVAELVRSVPETVGQYERVRIDGDTTISNSARVTSSAIDDLVDVYAGPRLVSFDDVQRHFEDGDAR